MSFQLTRSRILHPHGTNASFSETGNGCKIGRSGQSTILAKEEKNEASGLACVIMLRLTV